METKSIFKSMLIGGITGCLLVVACETKSKMDSTEVAEEKNETKFEGTAENDANFIMDVAKSNLCEIKTAELAVKKAKSANVKEFANMMIMQHKKMYNDMAVYAAKNSISIPDSIANDDISDYSDLKDKTGMEFDKKFMDVMVNDHKKVIDNLEDTGESNKYSQEIKSMASQTLPLVRPHYEKAKELQAKMEDKKM